MFIVPQTVTFDEYPMINRPWMPSTHTKGKKHVNKHRIGCKLRKKHRRAAKNR